MSRVKVAVTGNWRPEPTVVEKPGDDLWIGVKG
jgi:hypothetical protein